MQGGPSNMAPKQKIAIIGVTLVLCTTWLTSQLGAVLTRKWVDVGFAAFLKGETVNLTLSSQGALGLAPAVKKLGTASVDSSILSMAFDDEVVFAGTCFRGKVLVKKAASDDFVVFAETNQLMVTALFVSGNSLFVGTGPNGKVFEYDRTSQKLINTHETQENYIWAMEKDGKGKGLLLATGPNGRLLSLRKGKVKTRFDSKAKHILCLARAKDGNLLAGTTEESMLLDLGADGSGPARTIFQPNQPECRSISVDEKSGTIYLCATTAPKAASSLKKPVAGKPSRRRSSKKPAKKDDKKKSVESATTGDGATAVDSKKDEAKDKNKKKDEKKDAKAAVKDKVAPRLSPKGENAIRKFLAKVANIKPFASKAPAGKKVAFEDGAKHKKHAIYSIDPDGSVSTIFSSSDKVLYGALLHRGRIYVGSGDDGYVYRINPKKLSAELFLKIDEKQAVLMGQQDDKLLIGSGNEGRFYSVGPGLATTGSFTSEVKKLPHNAQFGSLAYLCENSQGATLGFETRSGFTHFPDESWSPWYACETTTDEYCVRSVCPSGRFFQYRVTVTKTEEATAPFSLRQVEVLYRPFNLPPRIESIEIKRPAVALSSNRRELALAASGKSSKGKKGMKPYMRSVKWKVKDPNGDKVLSTVFLRLEGEKKWDRLTEEELDGTAIVWETMSIPDGTYRLKVVVADSPHNFENEVRKDTRLSQAFVIDNTSPTVSSLTAIVKKNRQLTINGTARDAASRIINVEYALNGDYYKALEPKDGLFDSSQEDFTATIKLKRGKKARTVAVKAFDEFGNVTNTRIFIRGGRGSLKE